MSVYPARHQVSALVLRGQPADHTGFAVDGQPGFGRNRPDQLLAGAQVFIVETGRAGRYAKAPQQQAVVQNQVAPVGGFENLCGRAAALHQPVGDRVLCEFFVENGQLWQGLALYGNDLQDEKEDWQSFHFPGLKNPERS